MKFLPKLLVSTCGVVILNVFGEDWIAYEVLFILVFIDFGMGFLVGWINKELSSWMTFRTAKKLFVYLVLVVSAHQLVRYNSYLEWLEHGIVIYLAIHEMLSIIENAGLLGVPIPPYIKNRLASYINDGKIRKKIKEVVEKENEKRKPNL